MMKAKIFHHSKQQIRTRCVPLRIGLLTLLATLVSACNSVFYQPDRLTWSLPEQITPAFEEFNLPVGTDKEQLHVWRFRSRLPKVGTVLHFHGNAQNMSAHVWFVAWLIDHGFDLVTFDYRGYGHSDGVATRANTVADGRAVLDWLAKQPDAAPLFVVGQSLGGAVAFSALATHRSQLPVRAIVIESSFVSYRQLARRKLAAFPLTWALQWPLSFLVDDELSPNRLTLPYALPILFVHGDRDPVVPYSEGLEFADKARGDKNDVSLFVDENKGHTSCFAVRGNGPCKQRVLNFLNSFTEPIRAHAAPNKDPSK